jgi:hypothetical protein
MVKRFCLVLISLLGIIIVLGAADWPLEIRLGASLEIGRRGLIFASIASVCEDEEGNFYVLDRKELRVIKFSPDGRESLRFGQRGQGPGDFQSPRLVVFTSQAELVVPEDIFYISFFKTDGTFIRRLDLNGRLGLGYVGPDRFLGWIWRPEDRQQLLVDGKNRVVATFHTQPREAFSVSLPDETGRRVMFSYHSEHYVPEFLFDHSGGFSAVGISSLYDLTVLDENGRNVGSIKRDLEPEKISRKERAYLERQIREFSRARGWPDRAGRELAKKIPKVKTQIRAVRISPQYIFVFRPAPDITRPNDALPVDIFTIRGDFLGTATLPKIPVTVSGGAMYFVETDDAGNEYLVRTEYSLAGK